MTLWHYTSQAAAQAIEREGWLQTGDMMLARNGLPRLTEGGRYVWLIDEPNPTPRLLGFSDSTRFMAAQFVVDDPDVVWWPTVRRRHPQHYLDLLESHALPGLWWISEHAVRATRDPSWTDPTRLTRRLEMS